VVVCVCGRRTVHVVAWHGKPVGCGERVNAHRVGTVGMGFVQTGRGCPVITATPDPDWLPCNICGDLIPGAIHTEEMGMCLECSNLFWEHDHADCSWSCVADMAGFILKQRGRA
jgi:hypothetical protein